MEQKQVLTSNTLALLCIRMFSIYVAILGLNVGYLPTATIAVINWQMIGYVTFAIFFPFVLGLLLWCIAPYLSTKFFRESESRELLQISSSSKDLFTIGVKLIGLYVILTGIPTLLGYSYEYYRLSSSGLNVPIHLLIWLVVSVTNMVVGMFLLGKTDRFLKLFWKE